MGSAFFNGVLDRSRAQVAVLDHTSLGPCVWFPSAGVLDGHKLPCAAVEAGLIAVLREAMQFGCKASAVFVRSGVNGERWEMVA